MARLPQLLDARGMPVKRADLRKEIATPSMTGVRSPLSGYPSDGLTPVRLGAILREADAGNPIRYLELAEIIEERNEHYLGVLGTRKRSVTQLPITVTEGSEDPLDRDIAQNVRDWIAREELADELFDIMDAVGKGYSHTEIIWDYSEGQYWPKRLEWRDPRWFRFDKHDLKTPVVLDDTGSEQPYPAFKFIFARMQAKSGLPLRSGLARVATWNWLFKAFTARDWTIFTQTYGQPLRVGKYGPGASEKDKDALFKAVANIAGDCAAIIPQGMEIDFVEASNLGSSVKLYQDRCDWLDKQISKAVLGQTATTDAETGGLGSGTEHRMVQEDIETADANKLAAILNRDLIIPYVQLNYGPRKKYPTVKLARAEEEDLQLFSSAIGPLIDRGLQVPVAAVYKKFGLPVAKGGEEILRPMGEISALPQSDGSMSGENTPDTKFEYRLNTRQAQKGVSTAEQSQRRLEALKSPQALLAEVMADAAQPAMQGVMEQIETMLASTSSMEELREALLSAFPTLDVDAVVDTLSEGLAAAELAGRAAAEADSV